jgi:hypothetical protein
VNRGAVVAATAAVVVGAATVTVADAVALNGTPGSVNAVHVAVFVVVASIVAETVLPSATVFTLAPDANS